MRLVAKIVWLTGAVLACFLLVVGLLGDVLAEFFVGVGPLADWGMPGAIVLTGMLAATFDRTFPDRWP